jgi:MoaA/NifB/PqqE/SkfB family radical SAM enzyme
MCNIWRGENATPDPSLDTLTAVLDSPVLHDLRELDLTGGEPFLREDLRSLVEIVASMKERHCSRLRTVAVTTNALLTDRVTRFASAVAPLLETAFIDLVLACGVDALGSLHDQVRGVPGAWDRVQATLTGLDVVRRRHPNLFLGLKVTVGPWNVDRLQELVEYAADRQLFTIISPCIVTANRYRNTELRDELRLDAAQRERFRRFLGRQQLDWDFHRRTLIDMLGRGQHHKPCTAGINYAFVRSNGDLYPCPLIAECAGNCFTESMDMVLARPTVAAFGRAAGHHPQCRTCTEPGLERFSLPLEGFTALRLMAGQGPHRWTETFHQMGLDKFL